MTHKLPIEAIKTLLIACHEAKRVVDLQPPLPEGLTPGNLKVLDYIEYLERTAQPPKVSDIADLLQQNISVLWLTLLTLMQFLHP